MADEDITLDGKPLHSLRVADLKAALEKRNLPKSGPKNMLIKRLKGALMLENLQKSSSSHSGLQPNFQIGEEMCQNSFIKQYLAKQQELLCQRLEKEAQQGASESPAAPEEDEDHSEDNDSSSYVSDKSALARAEERGRGRELVVEHGMTAYDADMNPGPTVHHQEAPEAPGARMQQATFHQGHKEPPAPSPPCAVASLSVRVLDQPDQQGLPPAMPRAQENEGTAPSELGSAHSVLHLSRSARVSAGSNFHDDSDEDHDGDDESDDDDEDWGPGPGGARRDSRGPSQPQQMLPSVSSAVARSKRKLQPPQHIPVPQVHHTHTPMQLRHPTPPPSPPPDLFPLPDTPKQSPPNTGNLKGEGPEPGGGPRVVSFPPPTMQRQYSDSSSRSSSPEPPMKRRSGPLSLLVHRMESEGAFHADEPTSAAEMSGETTNSTAGSSSESPPQSLERKRQQEKREVGEKRQLKEEKEKEPQQEKEREALEQEREKKRLEEEVEKERKRLEEEEEKGRKSQEEQKEKQSHEEEKRREEKQLKGEYDKRWQSASKDIVVVTEAQDSDSSSDSDSKSDSSSHSSQSSSSGDKSRQLKRAAQGQETEEEKKNNLGKMAEKQYLPKREVSEPSTAAVTEVEPDLERAMAQQPASVAEPENSGGHLEESTTTKAFAARKISLTSTKTSPATTDGGAGEPETGTAAGRKRRWGSSTAVTAKKPSITITTDSLKSLIPDIKAKQEAVEVELHPEEMQLSGDEENLDTSHADQDKGLKIQRTVTQVVPGDSQENGQTNEEEEVEKSEKEKQRRISRDKRKTSVTEEGSETRTSVKPEEESVKVAPSNSLVRRSISQQKSGMSVTIDDPVRTTRQPSPPRGKVSNIIHVTNLVRPFTLGQLKELLSRTGSVVEEGFWIDKIKSHCYVTYATTEEAVATRTALHGVKWPQSNPKVLNVDFCEQHELNFHKWGQKPEKGEDRVEDHVAQPGGPQNRLPPLMPEKDRDRERDRDRDKEREQDRERDHGAGGVRDLWAERERAMERRERARGEREWDRDKVREFVRPGEDGRRSRSRERERRRRDRAKSKERKTEKKEKGDEPPAKLLDDLFLKTKAAPCIYWLPLTEEQAAQRLLERTERQKERERRHKEQKEEVKKSEEVKKEQPKGQEKDAAVTVNSGAAGRGPTGDRERDRGGDRERDRGGDGERDRGGDRERGRGGDRERDRGGDRERDRGGDRERDRGGDRERDRGGDRERDRGRDREEDKKRESGYRPRRPSTGAGSGRRSSSCSNPRDRRR